MFAVRYRYWLHCRRSYTTREDAERAGQADVVQLKIEAAHNPAVALSPDYRVIEQ
jgi:hypothetical protein